MKKETTFETMTLMSDDGPITVNFLPTPSGKMKIDVIAPSESIAAEIKKTILSIYAEDATEIEHDD